MSLKLHNILDYVGAAFLIACPFLFGFENVNAARNVFLTLGFFLAGYSLLTRYYYSVVKVIPLQVHMALDALTGLAVYFSPYLFSYRYEISRTQVVAHMIAGLLPIALVAFTRTRTEKSKTPEERRLTGGTYASRRHA